MNLDKNKKRSTIAKNIIKFLTFGLKLYEAGECDDVIENEFKLINNTDLYGYNKKEASNLLGISIRQFDRLIKKGEICKGRKIRGLTSLYWDKEYIDKLAQKK